MVKKFCVAILILALTLVSVTVFADSKPILVGGAMDVEKLYMEDFIPETGINCHGYVIEVMNGIIAAQ